ncbi:hypothetical protein M3Y98_00942200 [Aphelenchoides besseyi]|nr:hypothetical protein M3Y98_00942200 [Aphelenchoides besseyi]KAI6194348.1 hypothetical protein M3Y96_01115400 [Aphelenchoides besseyi]
MDKNGKPKATAIIGNQKVLDLNALLNPNQSNGTNGRTFSSPSTSTTPSITNEHQRVLAILRNAGIKMSTEKMVKTIRDALSSVNAARNRNLSTSPTVPSTSSSVHQTRRTRSQMPWTERLCFSGDYIVHHEGKSVKRDYSEQPPQYKVRHYLFLCNFQSFSAPFLVVNVVLQQMSTSCITLLHIVMNFDFYQTYLCILVKNARSHLSESTNIPVISLAFGTPDYLIEEPVYELQTSRCFECLAEFSTLRQLYKHIFYVHRSRGQPQSNQSICFICEKEVPIADAEKHADLHGEQALPFHCPACKWRTSSRHALLFHFEKFHDANPLLFCPYCLLKFPVKRPSSVKGIKRNTVTVPEFVEHCLDHVRDKVKKQNCDRCSVKFCAHRTDELRFQVEDHNSCHEKSSRLKVERRKLKDLFDSNPNQRWANAKYLPYTCYDCGRYVNSFQSHYRKSLACKNQNCQFETRCIKAQQQHEMVCPFLENAAARIPFGMKSLEEININSFTKQYVLLKCNMCVFQTRNAGSFNEHLRKCLGNKPKFANCLPTYQNPKRSLVDDLKEGNDLPTSPPPIKRGRTEELDIFRKPIRMFKYPFNVPNEKSSKRTPTVHSTIQSKNPTPSTAENIFELTARLGRSIKNDRAITISKKHFPFGRLSHRRN